VWYGNADVRDGEATVQLAQSVNEISLPEIRIVVLRGRDRGRALRVEHEEVVVGTAATANLQLTDETVSRHHATFRITTRGILVTDLDSTNGTRIGNRRIASAYVEAGETVDVGGTRLRIERQRGRVELPLSGATRFGTLLGRSVAARRLFSQLEQVASADVTVLLLGESGVGKDVSAQALHEIGARAGGPFIVFDCGAAAASVIESELFGHEKGAFTGALDRRNGAFQEAHGGTLFLDEIGELPRELQPKLLRAIDRREVRPVGSDRTRAVDVRIIAATNRNLRVEVNNGAFREDLFYRLNAFPIEVPPLRERIDDIPMLADHFWRTFTGDHEGGVPPELLPELTGQRWPGNVRELRHRVEQLALLRTREPVPDVPPRRPGYREAKAAALDAFEVGFLNELLARAGGNVSEAARLASMDRVHLSKLLRKHGLRGS
jgi:transcriptional regulator with GAF, ATPase, and Fis domain